MCRVLISNVTLITALRMGSPNLVCLVTMYTHQTRAKRKSVRCRWLCSPFLFFFCITACMLSVFVTETLCVSSLFPFRRRPDSLGDYGEWAIAGLWRFEYSYCCTGLSFSCVYLFFVGCCCRLQARRRRARQLWCLKPGASAPLQELSSTLILHPACFKLAPQRYCYHVDRDCTATS